MQYVGGLISAIKSGRYFKPRSIIHVNNLSGLISITPLVCLTRSPIQTLGHKVIAIPAPGFANQ